MTDQEIVAKEAVSPDGFDARLPSPRPFEAHLFATQRHRTDLPDARISI